MRQGFQETERNIIFLGRLQVKLVAFEPQSVLIFNGLCASVYR